jgi:hypothetical protein
MSLPANFAYVCSAPDSATKQKRIAELKNKFQAQSNFTDFSADIADVGNPSGVCDSDDFATFNQKAKEKAAFDNLRVITARHNVRDSVRAYALQRNEIIKRNKAKKAEKEKQKKDKFVRHPGWF